MSLMKRHGWELFGTVFGATLFFILAILFTILVITQISKIILALVDIELAALLVGEIAIKILSILGWTVLIVILLIFCVLFILIPLNALINKMIMPAGSWISDFKDGWGGFLGGFVDGPKTLYGYD